MANISFIVKQKLESAIKILCRDFSSHVKRPGKDFSRNRKLPFEEVILLGRPAQQQKKSTEDAPADAAKAFLYRLPQAFALQHEQRQHQHPADTEEQQGSTGSQIEQVPENIQTIMLCVK